MERERFKNALCDTVEVYASAIFIVGGLGLLAMYTAPIWLSILCLLNLVGPDNAMAASACAVLFNFFTVVFGSLHFIDKFVKNKVANFFLYFLVIGVMMSIMYMFIKEIWTLSVVGSLIVGVINIAIVVACIIDWMRS